MQFLDQLLLPCNWPRLVASRPRMIRFSRLFHSDVSVGRIDALVLDGAQHPIGYLAKKDFVLRQDGKTIPIREVGFESLPVDVLLLLDVSASMRVHVKKVADAAHGALAVLGNQDRVGVMVFDTQTRPMCSVPLG